MKWKFFVISVVITLRKAVLSHVHLTEVYIKNVEWKSDSKCKMMLLIGAANVCFL